MTLPIQFIASAETVGRRLDQVLAEQLPQYSRARLQGWAKSGLVRVNGLAAKPSLTLKGGEKVEVEPADLPPLKAEAEDLPLTILYEDDDVIAIDKAAGMVVHAGAGVHQGTVVNALLHRFGALSQLGGEERPGIVHRLDRYTSGVLLVARNDRAHRALSEQFAHRDVKKIYLAMAQGKLQHSRGMIDKPITRDPVHRTKMTARLAQGRTAHTSYEVLREYAHCSFLRVQIGTGRTHQIRVHLSSLGHPVIGDTLYGARAHAELPPIGRTFLHAHEITFARVSDGERITVCSPLPEDLAEWKAEVERRDK